MSTLFWKEMQEQWRSSRLLIVVAVLTAFGLLGPLSTKYLPVLLSSMPGVPEGLAAVMPTPDVTMAVGEYMDNIVQFGVILALLVPMAAVVGEKTTGTAEITLSKPVSRAAFLAAKLVSYGLVFAAGMLLAAAGGYYYTGLFFEWLPVGRFLAANGLILVYLLVFVSITLLASTLARSQLAAAGMAFASLIVFGLLGALPPLGPYLPASLIGWGRGLTLGGQSEPAWRALAASGGLILAALTVAWLAFRRQEL
jgi:ABC-2 type transport system permease protein